MMFVDKIKLIVYTVLEICVHKIKCTANSNTILQTS